VRDYVPSLFEAAARLDAEYAGERAHLLTLPAAAIRADLTEAVRLNAGGDPDLLRCVDAEPAAVLSQILDLLDRYWDAAFAVEWAHLEPQLLDAVADAGREMPAGVLPLLGELAPAILLDRRAGMVRLDRPHDHDVDVANHGPLRLTPSFYAWPHVRVTCDEPWALRLTYPVVPPSPHARRAQPADVLDGMRALAGRPRLDIIRLLGAEPRSTQELGGLLGLSAAAVSRHLRLLLDADIVRSRRVGYYVLYELNGNRLAELGHQIRDLGHG
jgi:DNA-binding transcriptional ArsR family regulator